MENFLDNEPVKRVEKLIKNFDSSQKILTLDYSARTAKDASNSLNCDIGAIVKSLLIKVEKDFLICLVSGDKRCSLNKLKKILKKKDIYMARAEEVKEVTGFSIGGVAPIAHIKHLDILIDSELNRFTNLYAAAGHPNCIFKISYRKLIEITNGSVKEISE